LCGRRAGLDRDLKAARLRRTASAGIQLQVGDAESRLCVGAGRQAVVLSGLVLAALAVQPATAADMSSLGIDTTPPPAPEPAPYINFFQELRLGVFAHNWIHDEGAPVDVSVELLSSALPLPGPSDNPYFGWFFRPRINVGGMINTGGKTSYAFTGLTWRIPIYGPVFFEGEFGGSVNNGPEHPEEDRIFMGCPINFRESGGFGVQLTSNIDIIASVEHNSHATFCTHIDPGITDVGVRVGYKF
jgi:lipid A 3-O-deacylase